MADANCLQFHDIWEKPSGQTGEAKDKLDERNAVSAKLYRAVRFVLRANFHLSDTVPEEPDAFATAHLGDADRAQFVGILGLIRADNWTDPTNGKTRPSTDDLYFRGHTEKQSFVIDRRFVDAVVEAVKEYTANSALFHNVYKLMRDEALAGFDNKPKAVS
ncbi:MAG: hypothetical protein KF773_30700 [Deltaproteobacteria bacterium]|nr:hypothetical protein [Deltaproteobacteria bacterium]MCW5807144.1 hypothetical protein [Deltaproteobacteria bacterium]